MGASSVKNEGHELDDVAAKSNHSRMLVAMFAGAIGYSIVMYIVLSKAQCKGLTVRRTMVNDENVTIRLQHKG